MGSAPWFLLTAWLFEGYAAMLSEVAGGKAKGGILVRQGYETLEDLKILKGVKEMEGSMVGCPGRS